MSFNQVFDFLADLQENNNKAWMDRHRDRYESSRNFVIDWASQIMNKVAEIDPDLVPKPPKKAVNRINNNLMFHPDRPVYKDNFGVGFDIGTGPSDFYVHIGLTETFIAGGIYNPDRDQLQAIRQEIDYNGEELKKLMEDRVFKNQFGDLWRGNCLKTSPKGYSSDNEFIDLLRLKSFIVTRDTTHEEMAQKDFQKTVLNCYKAMMPFGSFLNRALD